MRNVDYKLSKYLVMIMICVLALPSLAFCQSDPLDSSHFPSIDETCGNYPTNVWVTDGMQKVQQRVDHTPGCSNAATNVKWALPYAAKNEWTEFQIHEQAAGSNITLNSVVISDLVNAQTGTHIPASTNIIVYKEGYYHVQTVSDATIQATGYIPDVLIPAVDPYHHQTTNAFPATIAATQTQSVWIDILVPASAPSGYYSGTATIANGGSTYATIPIILAVWNFSLPSKATLRTHYLFGGAEACSGYYGGNGYTTCGPYPGAGGNSDLGIELSNLDGAYLLLDHRMSPSSTTYPLDQSSASPSFTDFDANWLPLFKGTSTHTLLPGAAGNVFDLNAQNNANAQAWMTHFSANGLADIVDDYHCDEPGSNAGIWTNCAAEAAIDDSSAPIVPKLVTSNIQNATSFNALGYINILDTNDYDMDGFFSPGNQRPNYSTWLAGGSASHSTQFGPYLWLYESCTGHGACNNYQSNVYAASTSYPSSMIEDSTVRNRVQTWIARFYNATGDIEYDIAHCWIVPLGNVCDDGNHNGTAGDPWLYIYAFGGNGDGTFIYPGTYAKIGTGVAGSWIPIPLPSIRLNLRRDGIQDYEYTHQLDVVGQSAFVGTQLGFITNAFTFPSDGSLITARNAMGNKLHQLGLQPTIRPPAPTILTIRVD